MSTQIQIRRDTTVNWESVNPVLADGEIGYDTTANKFKVGNGTDNWSALEYSGADGGSPVHIGDTAPSDPAEGDLWYETSSDTMFLFDGTAWFSTESCGSGGIEEAPEDGTQYARKDAAWEPVSAVHVSDDEPATPVTGQLWYKPTDDEMYVYDGSDWRSFCSGGDGGDGGSTAPPISDIGKVFSAWPYTGNGATNPINNGVDFSNDGMVWVKRRTLAKNHAMFDSVRGPSDYLYPNEPGRSENFPGTGVTSFGSGGFTLSGSGDVTNQSSGSYASWSFARAPRFFDVIKYTGDNVDGRSIPHQLQCKPGMIIVKCLDDHAESYWCVNHRGFSGENGFIKLNENAPTINYPVFGQNLIDADDESFRVSDKAATNQNTRGYVAYVFAHDGAKDSVIKCGSYTGNGAEQQIDLGWEPQFLILKNITATGYHWWMYDDARGWSQLIDICHDSSEANSSIVTPNSSGFLTSGTSSQESGSTYIYMAVRKDPNARYRPELEEMNERVNKILTAKNTVKEAVEDALKGGKNES